MKLLDKVADEIRTANATMEIKYQWHELAESTKNWYRCQARAAIKAMDLTEEYSILRLVRDGEPRRSSPQPTPPDFILFDEQIQSRLTSPWTLA